MVSTVAALSLSVVRMSPRLAVMYSTGVSVLTLTAGRVRAAQPLDKATISSRRHNHTRVPLSHVMQLLHTSAHGCTSLRSLPWNKHLTRRIQRALLIVKLPKTGDSCWPSNSRVLW